MQKAVFGIPQSIKPTEAGGQSSVICSSWREPYQYLVQKTNENISLLIFNAHAGKIGNPISCILLEWNPEYHPGLLDL